MTAGATVQLARTPLERIELFCDPGSVQRIRSAVEPLAGTRRSQPGDGIAAASGLVDGRPVLCYAYDPRVSGGALGQAGGATIARVLELAERSSAPVVGFIASGGARLQEGVAALASYARLFRRTVELSGSLPQISVVTGTAAGGACYMPALTDFVVMTEDARMFLTGPRIVERALGESIDAEALGGQDVHNRNGVCQIPVAGELEAIEATRELIGYLTRRPRPPASAEAGLPGEAALEVPREPRRSYDVRQVIRGLADGRDMLEVSPRWARNMVTAFCRIAGMPVGVVANQPKHLGGVIDCDASEKGASFIRACDRFGLPLVVLVDTPGFMPGTRQESAGIIRRGADLVRAFASADVPKLTIVLRKAFGGAYITMNSKELGADLVLAWPQAQIGIMAAAEAVEIVHRSRLEQADGDAPRLRAELSDQYAEEHLSALVSAQLGFVDEIVEPDDTRARLEHALWAFAGHRSPAPSRSPARAKV